VRTPRHQVLAGYDPQPRDSQRGRSTCWTLHRIGDQLGASVAAVAWVRQQGAVTSTIIGARTVEQLESNLSSLQVTIPDQQLAELDRLTQPQLDFPADLLTAMVIPLQQAGATINDVTSKEFSRDQVAG
jgi:aryl-alcohol dehydrogenase-like predicted oxidoreductase